MLLLHQETLALCFRNVSQCAVLINPRHVIETLDFAFNKNSNRCLPSTNQVFWSYHFILSCILHMYKTKPVKITYGRFQPRLLAARLYGGSCGLGGAPLCHRLQYLTPLGSIVLKYSRNILGPQRMSPHDFGGERSRFWVNLETKTVKLLKEVIIQEFLLQMKWNEEFIRITWSCYYVASSHRCWAIVTLVSTNANTLN